jgi:hypothetical protein
MEKSGNDAGSVAGNRATVQAKWTFMVYMAGDNNLDGAALRDIAEMAQAGSTKEVNILVQLDRIEDNLMGELSVTTPTPSGKWNVSAWSQRGGTLDDPDGPWLVTVGVRAAQGGRGCKQRMRQPGMAKRQQVTVDLTVGSNGEASRRRGKELSDGTKEAGDGNHS